LHWEAVPSGIDCAFHGEGFLISIKQFFASVDVKQIRIQSVLAHQI
jgi:hypothetical protein